MVFSFANDKFISFITAVKAKPSFFP